MDSCNAATANDRSFSGTGEKPNKNMDATSSGDGTLRPEGPVPRLILEFARHGGMLLQEQAGPVTIRPVARTKEDVRSVGVST